MRSHHLPDAALALLLACVTGCVPGSEAIVYAVGNHIKNTERQPLVEFVNELPMPVCAINLWRDQGPAADREANWLELTDLLRLEPGQKVRVGMQPRDAVYHLRAVDCGGVVRLDTEVTPIAGQQVRLRPSVPVSAPAASPSQL